MTIPLDHQLIGPRLTLRRFTAANSARVYDILSNWNVARMLRRASYPPSVDETAAWLARSQSEWLSGTAYRFGAVFDDRIIGCADIGEIDRGVGELGYWFDPAYWGRGLAREAAAMVRDFALAALGLRGLAAGHAVENVASGRILLGLGFRATGDDLRFYPLRREQVPYRRYELNAGG